MTICTSARVPAPVRAGGTLLLLFLLTFLSLNLFGQDTTGKKPPPGKDTVPAKAVKDTAKLRASDLKDPSGVGGAAAADTSIGDSNKIKITGKITLSGGGADQSGSSVSIKGTTKVAQTDSTGSFSILVAPLQTLVFSHVGYKTTEVNVDSKLPINLTLTKEENTLEQVTVSYGKQLKRDITGSVAKVDAADVKDINATEFGQKLQGKVAGIQIQQTSGVPGQSIVFRIRGAASLNSGNQPLVVVDGQPVNSDAAGGTGDINLINPDEIESYSVLKDAAATSLYGSRASNGVILITTKTAKIGKSSISVNAYYGLQAVPDRGHPNLMNAQEFANYMKGYYEDKITYENWVNPVTGTATVPADYANPGQYGKGENWYRALVRTAPMENYTVNISHGTDKVSSSTTMNYFNQNGVLYNTGTKRYAFRSNTEYRPNERIKLGLNLAPTYQIDHNTRGGQLALNGNRQVVAGAELSSPLIQPMTQDGKWILSTASYGMYKLPNYLQQAEIMDNDQTNFHFLGNLYAEVEVLRGLKARSSINGNILTQDYNAYYGTQFGLFGQVPPRSPTQSTAMNNSNNSYSWLNENTLDYNTKFGNHSLEVLAGYTTQKFYQTLRTVTGTGFATDETPFVQAATTTTGTTNSQEWTLASALARVNYDYKKRYYISGTIRNDGSSRFGAVRKYGTFPSVSVAWVASEEKFFPKMGALNFLKFRGSYGLTGNNNIGNYTWVSLLSSTNYVFNGATTLGESITNLGNSDLTWETSKQLDIGAELTLLHGRLNISYDYYNKRTEGMLTPLPVPYASGYESIQYNEGVFRIWGHDIQISSDNIKSNNFTWTTDFNISFNDNKVISLVNGTPIGGFNQYSDYNRTAVGHRIGELYGYVFEGLYANQADLDKSPKEATSAIGTAKMKDVNGDDTINIDDRTFIGRTNPKFIYGMSNNFTFKKFDLGVLIAGQVGNKIANVNLQNLYNLDGVFNVDKQMQNRWRSESNPGNGRVPRTLANTTELYRTINSTWVFSGDYLAVKNITLGYTFGREWLHAIKGIRVYGSVQNAFMFTKYPGQNPEVNDAKDAATTGGTDNGSYPVPRVFMVGANVNF